MIRSFTSVVTVAVIALLTSGCIIGTGRTSGDITVVWSFNGQSCMFVPQVQSVRVTIPGATLQNNGIYPCMTNGVSGITLLNFRGGSYDVTVEGLDTAGRTLFAATSRVVVNGDVAASFSLLPTQAASGTALVSWVFPGNLACSQIGDVASGRAVSRVLISVDGQASNPVDCAQGNATNANPSAAVTISNLSGAGQHQIDLLAQDSSGFTYLGVRGTLNVNLGGATSNQFQLQWMVGSLPLRWTFLNQGVTYTCQMAGVQSVYLNFRNQQTGRYTYADASGNPTAGQEVPCVSSNQAQGTFFPYFEAGNYEVYAQAPVQGTSGAYSSSRTTVPVLQVQAGVFAQSEAMGQQLVLQ